MIDETELTELLAEHDATERGLRNDERARLNARLGLDHAGEVGRVASADEAAGSADIVDISLRTDRRSRSERGLPMAFAAAALAVLAIGSMIVFIGNREEPSGAVAVGVEEPTPLPAPSPTPVPPPACPGAVVEFVAAVDAWDGIDQWSEIVDERRPEPDLPRLAIAAVEAWRLVAPQDELHAELDVPLDDPEPLPSESPQEFSRRRAAPIQLAFDRVRESSAEPGSPLSPCRSAIETVAHELGLPLDGAED